MKPRAAGGAQSTRSVRGRSCCFGGSRLAGRSRAQPERLGAAQWPGTPRVPPFLAFAAPVADSMQRWERAAVPRATNSVLDRLEGFDVERNSVLTFFVSCLKRSKHLSFSPEPLGCLPEKEGCEVDLLGCSRSPRLLVSGYSEVHYGERPRAWTSGDRKRAGSI